MTEIDKNHLKILLIWGQDIVDHLSILDRRKKLSVQFCELLALLDDKNTSEADLEKCLEKIRIKMSLNFALNSLKKDT